MPELLVAFGVRRFTPRACRNIERALAEVGLEARPPLPTAGPSGQVEVATRAEGAEPVPTTPMSAPVAEEARPAPDAWTVFLEGVSTRLDALATATVEVARDGFGSATRSRAGVDARIVALLALAAGLVAVIAIVATTVSS